MKIKILFLCAALALVSFQLASCSDAPLTRTYYDYFDTVITVTGYDDQNSFDTVTDELESMLSRYNELFDIYNCYDGVSNLKTVNDSAGSSHVTVPDEIIELLIFGREMYSLTDGSCNIAMGSVLRIWHEYRERALDGDVRVPTYEELATAASHSDIDSIVINESDRTVYITDPDTSIDVGAIAKGYAARKCRELLISLGADGYAVSLGGTVVVSGTKPDGSAFRIGVENPLTDDYSEIISLASYSLATSGSYQRYYDLDGVRYHHIIDPVSLFPKKDFVSLTIMAHDPALADALSTALFNISIDDGEKLLSRTDASAEWISSDGAVYKSDGFGYEK